MNCRAVIGICGRDRRAMGEEERINEYPEMSEEALI